MIDQEYERPKHIPPEGGWNQRELYIIEYIVSALPSHNVDDSNHEYLQKGIGAYFDNHGEPYFLMINTLGRPIKIYLSRLYYVRYLSDIGKENDIFCTHRLISPEDYICWSARDVNKEKPSDYSPIRKIQCEDENG